MPYVTSVERLATQRGELRGETNVIERLLAKRFGPVSGETRERLKAATLEQLDHWAENLLDAATLEEVFQDN